MKKKSKLIIFGIIIFIVVVIGLITVKLNIKGKVSDVTIIATESKIYSQKDINDAIDVVLDYFRENFECCVLKEISYAGDKVERFPEWLEVISARKAIILISRYETTNSPFLGAGSEPNSVYSNWYWILVRDHNGKWILNGYGY